MELIVHCTILWSPILVKMEIWMKITLKNLESTAVLSIQVGQIGVSVLQFVAMESEHAKENALNPEIVMVL